MTRAAARRMSTFSMELHILGKGGFGFGFASHHAPKPVAFMPEQMCRWGSET